MLVLIGSFNQITLLSQFLIKTFHCGLEQFGVSAAGPQAAFCQIIDFTLTFINILIIY